MKIKFEDGKTKETKKMTDKEAQIFEATQHLMDVLKIFDASFFLAVAMPEKDNYVVTGARRYGDADAFNALISFLSKVMLNRHKLEIISIEDLDSFEED
jgi:hypothetical protein